MIMDIRSGGVLGLHGKFFTAFGTFRYNKQRRIILTTASGIDNSNSLGKWSFLHGAHVDKVEHVEVNARRQDKRPFASRNAKSGNTNSRPAIPNYHLNSRSSDFGGWHFSKWPTVKTSESRCPR
jgi:hypothetical protein